MKYIKICGAVILMLVKTTQAAILPKNSLHHEDNLAIASNISKSQFFNIIARASSYYAPIIDKHHWGDLKIRGYWNSSLVNASAERKGDDWIVNIFGGLARRPEITTEGLTLVLCHELGHHLGGFPFVSKWASNEGQADYFATQVCLKSLWGESHTTNSKFRGKIHPAASRKCKNAYENAVNQDICFRIAAAGQSLAELLAKLSLDSPPSYATPDSAMVEKTLYSYPSAQCRLDTYIAGALCTTNFDESQIPGLYRNFRIGEKEAILASCSQYNQDHVASMKPNCWFKQKFHDRIKR